MLGLYAPYDRSEVTAAAVRLAGCAMRHGWAVSYLTTQKQETDVHPFWDGRVHAAKSGMTSWARDSQLCVWFAAHLRRYKLSVSVNSKQSHVLVPSWHQLVDGDLSWLHWYDRVICSCEEMYDALKTRVKNPRVLRTVPWSSGIHPSPTVNALRDAAEMRIYVPLDAFVMRQHPREIVELITLLLDTHSHTRFTVTTPCSWGRQGNKAVHYLVERHPGRFAWVRKPSLDTHVCLMHQHDWVWLPSTRSGMAVWADQAIHCGRPVLCWDVPPLNSVIHDGVNGRVIPCVKSYNAIDAPVVVWDHAQAVQKAVACWIDDGAYKSLKLNDWHVADSGKYFEDFWMEMFQSRD